MDLLSILKWRYATKRMNGNQIPQEKLERILESIQLSASSIGLQPYNVLIIQDIDLREKIRKVANNQAQITESSHLLIFAAWKTITQEKIDAFITRIAEVRNVSEDTLGTMRASGQKLLKNSDESNLNWSAKQSYIALGTALIAAAAEQVDATPMEGFDAAALDELLNLNALGLKSVTLMPLGFRDEHTDWLAKLPKVRTKHEVLFIREDALDLKA